MVAISLESIFGGAGIERRRRWVPATTRCPWCWGAVWFDDDPGGGDYHQGYTHVCTSCWKVFYLQAGAGLEDYEVGFRASVEEAMKGRAK